jgi:hypothetical protein
MQLFISYFLSAFILSKYFKITSLLRGAICFLVIHASVVLRAIQSQPLAARAIHDELSRLLDEDNGTELHLPDHIIEDIKGNF